MEEDRAIQLAENRLATAFPTAADRLARMPKVTPEVMMVVYLDEIAGRLAEMQDTLNEMVGEGVFASGHIKCSDEPTRFPLYARHVSFNNAGTGSVYVMTRSGKPLGDAPVEANGNLNIDFGARRYRVLHLVCDTGQTATVRFYKW